MDVSSVEGCFQTGAGKDGAANSPSAINTHCDGCEVSPRQMGGGTFLPSLPCSCLNWGNLQSGAKLWKSSILPSSHHASWEQAHNPLFLPSAICEQSGHRQGQQSRLLLRERTPRVTARQAGLCRHHAGCSPTVPKPGKTADLVTGAGVSQEPLIARQVPSGKAGLG